MPGQVNYADGVKFPASQVASTDVNTLDDYEEGTFQVTFTCGTSGTITIDTTQDTLSYVKIGRMVMISGLVAVSSVSSPVGSLSLGNLPFANQAGAEQSAYAPVNCRGSGLENTAATMMTGYIGPNGNTINIEHFSAGVVGNAAADVKGGSNFIIGAIYLAAQ